MASISNKPPPASKTKTVVCGYCNESLLHQNFSTHNERKHAGQRPFIAGETKITGYFSSKSKKRKTQDGEQDGGALAVVQETANDELPLNLEVPGTAVSSSSSQNDSKLDEILQRVKDIQVSISTDKNKGPVLPPIATPQDIAPTDDRIKQMHLFRSIDEIVDLYRI